VESMHRPARSESSVRVRGRERWQRSSVRTRASRRRRGSKSAESNDRAIPDSSRSERSEAQSEVRYYSQA